MTLESDTFRDHPEFGRRVLIDNCGVRQALPIFAVYVIATHVVFWGVPALLLIRRAAGHPHPWNPYLGLITAGAIILSLVNVGVVLAMMINRYSIRYFTNGFIESFLFRQDRFIAWSEIVSAKDCYGGQSILLRSERSRTVIPLSIYDQTNQQQIRALLVQKLEKNS